MVPCLVRRRLLWASLALVLWSVPLGAQTLTPAQLATLKADIAADPALNTQPLTADGAFAIAQAYNLPASPVYWVWRTSVSKSELTNTTSPDGTTFTWVGNGFITRSVGEQAAWREMFSEAGTINPALPQVRQGFTDVFSGTGNAAANRTHLAAVSRRQASRFERLYAVGTGSAASPGTMVVEGLLTYPVVQAARELP